eukprot:XP_011660809.1 PREDICTED: endonuclease 8-like 2 [Strongylocentrotus purpuratus]
MPEGPSVRRWGDTARQFIHKRIKVVRGVSKVMERERWRGACINAVVVYGKQLFLHLLQNSPSGNDTSGNSEPDTSARKKTMKACDLKEENIDDRDDSIWYRYHFLMWGSLRANEYKEPSKRSKRAKKSEAPKAPNPMVEFYFEDKTFLVFYGGSIRIVDGPCEDEGTDVLSETFDFEKAATALLKPIPICYTIMDQMHFAGAGNIVKNEVLYACRMHPLELGSNLTRSEAVQLAEEVVRFTKDWLKWEEELPEYQKFGSWLKMYWKFKCPDGHKTMRGFFGDELKRMTMWCPECQGLRVESDISKAELANIGKIKKTTNVKRENKDESDDDGDVKRPKKMKSVKAPGKRKAVVKMSGKKNLRLNYEDDEDFDQVPLTSCTSKSRKVSVSKGQKKKRSPPTRTKPREREFVEPLSECKVSEGASKKQSRKRTHSEMTRTEQNKKDKVLCTKVKQECRPDDADDVDVKNKRCKGISLKARVKVENQGIESDKSARAKTPQRRSARLSKIKLEV